MKKQALFEMTKTINENDYNFTFKHGVKFEDAFKALYEFNEELKRMHEDLMNQEKSKSEGESNEESPKKEKNDEKK